MELHRFLYIEKKGVYTLIDKVDFFCIGAAKSGTTTLHNILLQHKDICLPETKETKFFSDDALFEKGLDYYYSNFKCNNKIVGEIDPSYMYFSKSAERIYETFGKDVKFIVMLRDPIKRAYSHYAMSKRLGFESLDFFQAITEESSRLKKFEDHNFLSYVQHGMYLAQVKSYLKFFDISNFLFIKFKDFVKNEKYEMNRVCQFLGVKEFSVLNPVSTHKAETPRFERLNFYLRKYNIKKRIVRFIPRRILEKFRSLYFYEGYKESIDQRSIEYLKKVLFSDIEELEKLTKLNLSDWVMYEKKK